MCCCHQNKRLAAKAKVFAKLALSKILVSPLSEHRFFSLSLQYFPNWSLLLNANLGVPPLTKSASQPALLGKKITFFHGESDRQEKYFWWIRAKLDIFQRDDEDDRLRRKLFTLSPECFAAELRGWGWLRSGGACYLVMLQTYHGIRSNGNHLAVIWRARIPATRC